MYNLSPRRLLTRAGTGVAVIALVALAGYSVGQTQSPQRHRRRVVGRRAPCTPHLKPLPGDARTPAS